MQDIQQFIADNITNEIMSYFFGDRFRECENIEDDKEMDHAYEYFNEQIYEEVEGKLSGMREKLNELLRYHRNLFHSDLVFRALFDNNVTTEDFINAYRKIDLNDQMDGKDEYVPHELANV